jgi:hypothetical protein
VNFAQATRSRMGEPQTKLSDSDARVILERQVPKVTGQTLGWRALDNIQSVARGETGYGAKWAGSKPPASLPIPDGGVGSFNWGAVKRMDIKATVDNNGKFTCGNTAFPAFDEDPITPHCFRLYPNHDEGAAGMIRVLWGMKHVRALLASGGGTPGDMAHAMRQDGYYTLDESKYAAGLARNTKEMLVSMGRGTDWTLYAAGALTGLSLLGLGVGGWKLGRAGAS